MNAAMQAANALAWLRLAAYAELLDAGCPADCITFGPTVRGDTRHVNCGLWVCGSLAWEVCATWDPETATLDVTDQGWYGSEPGYVVTARQWAPSREVVSFWRKQLDKIRRAA